MAFTQRGDWDIRPEKLDHLVHAMHESGALSSLRREQVEAILYALRSAGHEVPAIDAAAYNEDFLMTTHNADFQRDPRFVAAYERGVEAAGGDYRFRWRVHVGLWAATCATEEEKRLGKGVTRNTYDECFEEVRANFAEFRNVVLIRGSVPGTLPQADTDAVAYLHLDMNNVAPEIATINHFWDWLVKA